MRYFFVMLIMAISGCSDTPFKRDIDYGGFNGHYKIGTPYQIDGKWYYPEKNTSYDEVGMASWYGDDFHGKKTANGDTFDKNAITAAHNTLPLPSIVKVTNLENNRSLNVVINDRGPFKKNRIIDLSERAADILGFKEQGTANVRVTFQRKETQNLVKNIPGAEPIEVTEEAAEIAEITAPRDITGSQPIDITNLEAIAPAAGKAATEQLFIQAGTFSIKDNAIRTEERLKRHGNAFITEDKIDATPLYRVRLGPLNDEKMANIILRRVIDSGHMDAMIIREQPK